MDEFSFFLAFFGAFFHFRQKYGELECLKWHRQIHFSYYEGLAIFTVRVGFEPIISF